MCVAVAVAVGVTVAVDVAVEVAVAVAVGVAVAVAVGVAVAGGLELGPVVNTDVNLSFSVLSSRALISPTNLIVYFVLTASASNGTKVAILPEHVTLLGTT